MANSYLEFCTVVECRDETEFAWFHRSLMEDVCDETDDEGIGFDYRLEADTGRVEFTGGDSGDPNRLGELLHRFLECLRPRETYSFTWAVVCDRTWADAFDGGAIVATPSGWTRVSGSEWVSLRCRQWELSGGNPWGDHHDLPRDDWRAEVASGDTQLGYWDWVIERLDEPCVCEQPGFTNCGVPGVLAWTENGRIIPDAEVERCDACERFPSDEAARDELIRRGLIRRDRNPNQHQHEGTE